MHRWKSRFVIARRRPSLLPCRSIAGRPPDHQLNDRSHHARLNWHKMRVLPHTQSHIDRMLEALGVSRIEELIAQVPAGLRESAEIALPTGLPEADVSAALNGLAAQNQGASLVSFLGGGAYRHYIPAA